MFLAKFVPESVEIIRPDHVVNHFKDGVIVDSKDPDS